MNTHLKTRLNVQFLNIHFLKTKQVQNGNFLGLLAVILPETFHYLNIQLLNVHFLNVDVNDEKAVLEKIDGLQFDVVAEFIAFVPAQLERDYRLFKGRTNQFIFISFMVAC